MFGVLRKWCQGEQTSKKERIISAFVFFVYVFCLGYTGHTLTHEQTDWYYSLKHPAFNTTAVIESAVWTILFVLLGMSAYIIWNYYKDNLYRKIFIVLYFINGILLYTWPRMFFNQQSMANSLYIMFGLVLTSVFMMCTGYKSNVKSSSWYLLMPYFLWLLYSTYLNIAFIDLNF